MIAFVKGTVYRVEPDTLVIEQNGLGLTVLAPLARFSKQPIVGEEIFLHTHLQIREDAWMLFGFPEVEQLTVFRALLTVSGVGAKIALAIVNTLSVQEIVGAVQHGQADAFSTVSGVGKKTAQRIVVDLKDKFAKWDGGTEISGEAMPAAITQEGSDLLQALSQLGYNATESRRLAAQAFKNAGEDAGFSALLKEALRLAAQQ